MEEEEEEVKSKKEHGEGGVEGDGCRHSSRIDVQQKSAATFLLLDPCLYLL